MSSNDPDTVRTGSPLDQRTERVRLLRRSSLFEHMRPEDLAILAARAKDRAMRSGEVLFRRGDPGTVMFVILAGQIRIALPSRDGREQVLRMMQPGDVLGELALLDGGSRSADAVAETKGRLLVVERADFLSVLRTDPSFAVAVTNMLSHRLRTVTWLLESMMFNDATGRLAATLLILCQGKPGRRIDITQGALGDRVGAARETLNRKLREWQAAGFIALEPGRITVLNAEALRQLAPAAATTDNELPQIW
jgi:CRP-like cAMP-binding protein